MAHCPFHGTEALFPKNTIKPLRKTRQEAKRGYQQFSEKSAQDSWSRALYRGRISNPRPKEALGDLKVSRNARFPGDFH